MVGKAVWLSFVVSAAAVIAPAHVGIAQSVATDVRPESSRRATVSVDVVDTPLADVLRTIARQAGKRTSWNDKVMDAAPRVSLRVNDVPMDVAFAQALAGTGLRAVVMADRVMFVRDATSASVAQGDITGKVVDAKTRQGVRGATISLSGTGNEKYPGTLTRDDGSFRVPGVVPGSYTIHVRMLGYIKAAKVVTVVEGQPTSVEIALEPSVNALDQVVVTGTVVATAQREVPNAMTVITAKDIEQRGITKIDQLFRGDVPGLFAMSLGSASTLDQVTMFSRGVTALSGSSAGTGYFTNPIKTYVDGVELADPQYLSQLDPKSIERIEIVTGPQASTIYGSNAINGVMQVFTKRGSTNARPQLTATLLSGWVENNFSAARTPQHDYSTQVNGTEGHWSYNAGGSWTYMGPWTPGKQTARLDGFGGARIRQQTPLGQVTADGSIRLATTQTQAQGTTLQVMSEQQATGRYSPSYFIGRAQPYQYALAGQTLGLTLSLAPTSWWSHELVVGDDRSAVESRQTLRGYTSPAGGDTMLSLSQSTVDRRSLRYASTVQVPLMSAVRLVGTVGADGWQTLNTSVSAWATALTGTLTTGSAPTVTRLPGHNAGGFVQGQVGVWDQLFVTYGLRAEWNPTYGKEAQPNWAPRYGVSYSRDLATPFGPLTAKLRASYGRATRPPAAGASGTQTITQLRGTGDASFFFTPYYGDYIAVAANPDLGPEHQGGGEGGLELYLGSRGSLVVTRYNQTVDALIARPVVDSVRSLDPSVKPTAYTSCDAAGYCYYSVFQNLNIGAIRNQGWELQGTVNMGPLTAHGTYSWTKSRTIGINPQYRAFFTPASYPQYQPGATFSYLPEHTWGASVTYAQARSMVALNLSGTGMLASSLNDQNIDILNGNIRLSNDRARLVTGNYVNLNAGYVQADLNASQRLSSRVEGVLQVQNLGNAYRNDYNALYASLGRQTKLGVRLR